MCVLVARFYRPEDTKYGRRSEHHKKEVFASDMGDENNIETIKGPYRNKIRLGIDLNHMLVFVHLPHATYTYHTHTHTHTIHIHIPHAHTHTHPHHLQINALLYRILNS